MSIYMYTGPLDVGGDLPIGKSVPQDCEGIAQIEGGRLTCIHIAHANLQGFYIYADAIILSLFVLAAGLCHRGQGCSRGGDG